MQLLVSSFNATAAASIMCRDTVSVSWDGQLFDCDFNQQLALGLVPSSWRHVGLEAPSGSGNGNGNGGAPALTVHQLRNLDQLQGLPIACDSHCFGCTAGSGSSCGGQL